MKQESGRSLIEIIGVLAIGALITAGAFGLYNAIRNNQKRTVAAHALEQIAQNTKILMGARGDYHDVCVEYLVQAGALDDDCAPIGGSDWSITSSADGSAFSINLTGLSHGECEYLLSIPHKWATRVLANGYEANDACFSSDTNQVSFIIE